MYARGMSAREIVGHLQEAPEAINRALFAWNGARSEEATLYYLVRLLAYGLILWAILEKNWPRNKPRRPDQ